ncbi:HTH_38 domain-containing protein [Trichonephila clavipes]|nr:HTH_38 domain-containing protein [Trichonephila clavipes]
MRIYNRCIQESTTDRRGRSYPLQCNNLREHREIVRMTVTDRSVTSRKIAQHIESLTYHSLSARTIRRCYSKVVCPQVVHCLVHPLRRTTDVSAANSAMEEGCGWQNEMKLSILTCHVSVCNTTMVGFDSGDTAKRGFCTAALCTTTLVLHRVLCYGVVLDITLTLL